jgi:apolipoprotein N-acyltransferase
MMSRIQQFFKLYWRSLLAGAFSGILIGTSYIPFSPWALFFCYVPLWLFTLKTAPTWRQILAAGWMAQFVLTLIGFHWIAFVAHEYGFMPWPVAIAVLLLFAAGMHIYIPLALASGIAISKKFSLKPGATVLILAGSLALFENFWPSIFSWNLGYPLLWIHSPLAQWADVIGFAGLSFCVYLLNAWVVWLLIRRDRLMTAGSFLIVAGTMALLYFGGIQRGQRWQNPDSEIKALLVQANIGNMEKLYAERGAGFQQVIVNQFFDLTKEGIGQHPDADLVIWPESAFPDVLDPYALSRNYPSQFVNFAQSIQKPILTGAYSKDPPGKKFRDDYNGVFLYNEKGELVGEPYHKTNLLIFGEYIPFGHEIPLLAKLNPGGVGWGRGTGPMVIPFQKAAVGIQICYESLAPGFSSELALKGAEILVNVTNDSWFGPRFEPQQHLFMTLARGIETRRPLIRSTNTGITSAILADGTVLDQSPIYQKWQGLFSVKFQKNPELTFHSRFGSWLSVAIFVFLLLTIAIGRNRARTLSSRLE